MSTDAAFELLCNCNCGCQAEFEPKKNLKLPFMDLLHEFTEAHKEKCSYLKQLETEMTPVQVKKLYPTGTTYEGMANLIGISVYGTYTMPHGVAYKGELDEEGMFHGEGELIYPSGNVLRGKWEHGDFMGKRQLFFNDYIVFLEDNWTYCNMPDRRFSVELLNGIQPAGNSYLCAQQPHIDVPLGYYDCGQGFYLPSFKCIYTHQDITEIVRSPSVEEQNWIVRNCRKSPDLPVGPIPDFYETVYKPTPLLDPTVEGDSYQSSESSYSNEDLVSTLSARSADQRWNRFHQMSIDSWLERAAHSYRARSSTESEAAQAGGGPAKKPVDVQSSTLQTENLDSTTEAMEPTINQRVSDTDDKTPNSPMIEEQSTDSITTSTLSDKFDFVGQEDKAIPEPVDVNTINVYRRSFISPKSNKPHSNLKPN